MKTQDELAQVPLTQDELAQVPLTQDELAQVPLTQDELNRLNGIRVGTEVLIGNTRWRVDGVYSNSVHVSDTSRGTAGIRARLKDLFDITGTLSYNSLELSRINGGNERGSVTTNTITRTPGFIVQLPDSNVKD